MEPTTAGTWATNRAEWNALIGRYLPQLKRFAQAHLPAYLRGTITADDLVQEVVLSGIRQLHRLEFRHEHAFLSYLLTSIRHRIVDEIRRTRRQPALVLVGNWNVDPSVSPLQQLITRENLRRYAKALACLRDRDRQLIVLRLVRGLSCRGCRRPAGHAQRGGSAHGCQARTATPGEKPQRSRLAFNVSRLRYTPIASAFGSAPRRVAINATGLWPVMRPQTRKRSC